MLSILSILLLLVHSSLITAAPVKGKSASIDHRGHADTSSSKKVDNILKPSSAIGKDRPRVEHILHRMYRKNRFDPSGREMTRQEFDEMLAKDPTLEAKMYQDAALFRKNMARRYYLRSKMTGMLAPEKVSKYLKHAEREGYATEDLFRGGQDKSPEAFAKRARIRGALTRLRGDISRILECKAEAATLQCILSVGEVGRAEDCGRSSCDAGGRRSAPRDTALQDSASSKSIRFPAIGY